MLLLSTKPFARWMRGGARHRGHPASSVLCVTAGRSGLRVFILKSSGGPSASLMLGDSKRVRVPWGLDRCASSTRSIRRDSPWPQKTEVTSLSTPKPLGPALLLLPTLGSCTASPTRRHAGTVTHTLVPRRSESALSAGPEARSHNRCVCLGRSTSAGERMNE